MAIGRKPEKRCGGSRQWFRAARRAPAAELPRRACMVCDTLHSYIPYYNRRPVLSCAASGRDGGIWYRLSVSGRWQVLQRGASGIIAACVGLLFAAVECVKLQEAPL
nr:MAG TPA: hypothetical protein [Caudoviricetes sp.]